MKIILTLCAAISLLTAARAQEQLHVQFSQKRSLYLQYEPIDLTVVLTNTTDAPITLATSAEGKPWLSFLIFVRDTNSIISPISPISLDPVTIPPGATRPVTVNILPHYSIRDTGGYNAQAVISIPGLTPIMTGKLYFTIGKGETLWKKNIYHTGIKRTCSLIRFLGINEAALYLRVEEPDQNLVYNTTRLGPVVAFAEPMIEFDRADHIHIVQVINSHHYRYTQTDADGNIIAPQETRSATATSTPTIIKEPDGTVAFVGGYVKQDQPARPALSETQK